MRLPDYVAPIERSRGVAGRRPVQPSPAAAHSWQQCMRRGDFEAAWRISDGFLRERSGAASFGADTPPGERPWWDGRPLEGRSVIVDCHRGLGDTIQFLRYLPWLADIAGPLTLRAPRPIMPLARRVVGSDAGRAPWRIVPAVGVPTRAHDREAVVEIMELAHVFRTTLDTIPNRVPYLRLTDTPPALPRREDRLAVGMVWRAGPYDVRRSMPFARLTPLTHIPGIDWCVLQRGAALAECQPDFGKRPRGASLLATARVMRSLDLVITVDTMPAHLAGALGVPVWTLLHTDADWRWLEERSDSPWYPTMRLFRQRRAGDWTAVVRDVADALSLLARRHTS